MSLQQQCLAEIERAFTICEKHYNLQIPRPKVTFSNRMTSTAGKAICRLVGDKYVPDEIRLSNKLLNLNGEVFVTDTPAHEAAHIVAEVIYGDLERGHGKYWQEIMAIIGREASRCHNMKQAVPTFKYVASCGTEVQLKKVRHNRVQQGATYVVKKTRGVISADGYKSNGK